MYTYRAEVMRVIDGDTVELEVDCGFRLKFRDRFRLASINAPEKDASSTNYLIQLLSNPDSGSYNTFTIQTTKPDKYGRWLVTILSADGSSINQKMIDAGHAIPY